MRVCRLSTISRESQASALLVHLIYYLLVLGIDGVNPAKTLAVPIQLGSGRKWY